MAECRCDACEHCLACPLSGEEGARLAASEQADTIPAPPPSSRTPERSLLTPERLQQLRGPMGGGRMLNAAECCELADAYETAVRLLDASVREDPAAPIRPSDVAWLKLREAGYVP